MSLYFAEVYRGEFGRFLLGYGAPIETGRSGMRGVPPRRSLFKGGPCGFLFRPKHLQDTGEA